MPKEKRYQFLIPFQSLSSRIVATGIPSTCGVPLFKVLHFTLDGSNLDVNFVAALDLLDSTIGDPHDAI